jgi:hypothetical protein
MVESKRDVRGAVNRDFRRSLKTYAVLKPSPEDVRECIPVDRSGSLAPAQLPRRVRRLHLQPSEATSD